MKRFLSPRLAVAASRVIAGGAPVGLAPSPSLALWRNRAAHVWTTEALPAGGGELGRVAPGGAAKERRQVNHGTLWTGRERTARHHQPFGDFLGATGDANPIRHRRALDPDCALLMGRDPAGGVDGERMDLASQLADVVARMLIQWHASEVVVQPPLPAARPGGPAVGRRVCGGLGTYLARRPGRLSLPPGAESRVNPSGFASVTMASAWCSGRRGGQAWWAFAGALAAGCVATSSQ